MHFLIMAVVAAIIVVAMVVAMSHLVASRAGELADVNFWFTDRMSLFSPLPLPPQYAAVVKSIMDDDGDLWWHLGRGRDAVDHEFYAQQVIDIGRYLHVFGPVGTCHPQYHPSIYYGIFEEGEVPVLRVWIEFRYQGETVWVLTEDNGVPKITRFSDFRVNHPGLVYRHPIYFVHDGLDANIRS